MRAIRTGDRTACMFKTLGHTRCVDSGVGLINRVTAENIKRHCSSQVASPSSSFLFLLFHFYLFLLQKCSIRIRSSIAKTM